MATTIANYLLQSVLGTYIELPESLSWGLSTEINLDLKDVRIKEDVLTKLKLPIKIKHGVIKKLKVIVKWTQLSSSPVVVTIEGLDLLVIPQNAEDWEFPVIFGQEYLRDILDKKLKAVIDELASKNEQSQLQKLMAKVMDNLQITITKVHFRMEETVATADTKQSTFGILMHSLKINTVDKDDKETFHDREKNSHFFKKLVMEGLAVYLNPADPVLIHKAMQSKKHAQDLMESVIVSYKNQMSEIKQEIKDRSLSYILEPFRLEVKIEQTTKTPLKVIATIFLDEFNVQLLHKQMKSILSFVKLRQQYTKRSSEQEKTRKYKFLRQPEMNSKQRLFFAVECIKRSIRTRNGHIFAFKMPFKQLKFYEDQFKRLFLEYYQSKDQVSTQDKLMEVDWYKEERIQFWQIVSCVPGDTLNKWIREVVEPQEILKRKTQSKNQGLLSYAYSFMPSWTTQPQAVVDDDDEDFFDATDNVEKVQEVKENTSFELTFEVNRMSLLIGILNASGKIEGIEVQNSKVLMKINSPTKKLEKFIAKYTVQDFGVNLTTFNPENGKFIESIQVVMMNKLFRQSTNVFLPQLTLEVNKGNISRPGIEYNINLKIGSIVYKYYEDLLVRLKAITALKFDESMQTAARDRFEELSKSTQNTLNQILYTKKNHYTVSVLSPVFILPINGTYDGKNSSVWVLRTGDMIILSQDLSNDQTKLKSFNNALTTKYMQDAMFGNGEAAFEREIYEAFGIKLSQIGLQYYQSYRIYEKQEVLKNISGISPKAIQNHNFSDEQNAHFNTETNPQSLEKQFSVLEEFDINCVLKLKKNTKKAQTIDSQICLKLNTSHIKINLSHCLYNLISNFGHIFKISEGKMEAYQKNVDESNAAIRESVQMNAVLQGFVEIRSIASIGSWVKSYCVLSGKYLYFYEDKDKNVCSDYLYLKQAEVIEDEQKQCVTVKIPGDSRTIRVADTKIWSQAILSRSMEIILEQEKPQETQSAQQQSEKTERKTELSNYYKGGINPAEVIKFEFEMSMPKFQLKLLKLKLMPDAKSIVKPAQFEDWMQLQFLNMVIVQESRKFDSKMLIRIEGITLRDDCTPRNMMLRKRNSNYEACDHELSVLITRFQYDKYTNKKKSPLYDKVEFVTLGSIADFTIKFMPNTINSILKFFKHTRRNTKPVDDSPQIVEEYDLHLQNDSEVSSVRGTEADPDLRATEKAVVKEYDSDCSHETDQASKMSFKIEKMNVTMHHPEYTMELFRMVTTQFEIKMESWYDHSSFGVYMNNMAIYDLSGWPFTKSPKKYYDSILAGLATVDVVGNGCELIACAKFKLDYTSYASSKCKFKPKDYNSKMVMRMSPVKFNYFGEPIMRLNDYFQQQFMSAIMQTDPYKNPKQEFERIQKSQNLTAADLTDRDLKQPNEIGMMDIQIEQVQIFLKDRVNSQAYILIESPLIKIDQSLTYKNDLVKSKPLTIAVTQMNISLDQVNFFYGKIKKDNIMLKKDRLELLLEPFGINIEIDNVTYSEVIQKVDYQELDKSMKMRIKFQAVHFVLPQLVYTYILRANDLNLGFTDSMKEEFFFQKWTTINDHYKTYLVDIISQVLLISIPNFSLTLKHSDGSFIAKLLLRGFTLEQTRYWDTKNLMVIGCNQFYIFDQISDEEIHYQSIICPIECPMSIEFSELMDELIETQSNNQLSVKIEYKPNGDKDTNIEISGLKIFIKIQLFILLQQFFGNAFPVYKETDKDKPWWFNGNDPDVGSKQTYTYSIKDCIICFLNRQGFKSIVMQGEFLITQVKERIKNKEDEFRTAKLLEMREEGTYDSDEDEQILKERLLYDMTVTVKNLTPFVCSLTHLDQKSNSFQSIKKRQLLNPLTLTMKTSYYLKQIEGLDQQLSQTDNSMAALPFGCAYVSNITVESLKLKLSITDLHLIFQIAANASETMAQETIKRLKKIQLDLEGQDNGQDGSSQKSAEINKSHKQQGKKKDEVVFDKYIDTITKTLDPEQKEGGLSASDVMTKLGESMARFKRVAEGYTGQQYRSRGNFLEFIRKDILLNDLSDDEPADLSEDIQMVQEVDEEQEKDEYNSADTISAFNNNYRDAKSDFQDKEQRNSMIVKNFFVKRIKPAQSGTIVNNSIDKSDMSYGDSQLLQNKPTVKANRKISFSNKLSISSKSKYSKYSRSKPSPSNSNNDFGGSPMGSDQFLSAKDGSESDEEDYKDAVEDDLDHFLLNGNKEDQGYLKHRATGKFAIFDKDDEVNKDQEGNNVARPILDIPEEAKQDKMKRRNTSFKELRTSFSVGGRSTLVARKSVLENIIKSTSLIKCNELSFLAINDFDNGFSPVLKVQIIDLNMDTTDTIWQKTSLQEFEVFSLSADYFNMLLGEWEPLLEIHGNDKNKEKDARCAVFAKINTTVSEKNTAVTIQGTICINHSEQMFKNIMHSKKSWAKTPQFFSAKNDIVRNSNLSLQDEDVESEIINQIPKNFRDSVAEQNLLTIIEEENDDKINKQDEEQDNQGDLVTPFSIFNYTCEKIMIFRGGNKQHNRTNQTSFSGQKLLPQSYNLQPGQQLAYEVAYNELASNNRIVNEEKSEIEKALKLRQGEIVSIQFTRVDFTDDIDLNKNCEDDPFVQCITQDEALDDQFEDESQQPNQNYGIRQPLLIPQVEIKQSIRSKQFIDSHNSQSGQVDFPFRKFFNYLFYGTMLKDMRKVLIVRNPYCFHNKTNYRVQIKISELDSNDEKRRFIVKSGEIYPLDQIFWQGHTLQTKVMANAHQNISPTHHRLALTETYHADGTGFSKPVQIQNILCQPMNEGTGIFCTDDKQMTICIKIQSGELSGTSDIVLLPPVVIKNVLPAFMELQQQLNQEQMKDMTIDEIQRSLLIHKSQERAFYNFSVQSDSKSDKGFIGLKIRVDGFDEESWTSIILKEGEAISEREIDLHDPDNLTVKIGIKFKYSNAGFAMTFFAYSLLILETPRILSRMHFYPGGTGNWYGRGHERRSLAGAVEAKSRKYIICNKESQIVVGIEQGGQIFDSPLLENKQVGVSTPFRITTQQPQPNNTVHPHTRFDLVCTTALPLANYQDSIYTKVIQISPKYVVCNLTKGYLEIAQENTEERNDDIFRVFALGEKREWYWPDPLMQLLQIRIKKVQRGGDSTESPKNKIIEDKKNHFADSDSIRWNWSTPFGISINKKDDVLSFPICVFEDGPGAPKRQKIYVINKKEIGPSTFLIITDEEPERPAYVIRNKCTGLAFDFYQSDQPQFNVTCLKYGEETHYAHVAPLASNKNVIFNLYIGQTPKKTEDINLDLDGDRVFKFDYSNKYGQQDSIIAELKNDGLTKTLTFRQQNDNYFLQGISAVNNNEQKVEDTTQQLLAQLQKVEFSLTLQQLSISLIGYRDISLYETEATTEKNHKQNLWRTEIALITLTDLKLKQVQETFENKQTFEMKIQSFQVDNQSKMNPLFQTILYPRITSDAQANGRFDHRQFLEIQAKFQHKKETNLTIIEKFHGSMANIALNLDDEFVLNIMNFFRSLSTEDDSSSLGVHPIFMLNSFNDRGMYNDIFGSNSELTSSQNTSSADMENDLELGPSNSRQTTERKKYLQRNQTQAGVFILSKIECPEAVTEFPPHMRHWNQQEVFVEQTMFDIRDFHVQSIRFEISFVNKTKYRNKKSNRMDGPMQYLQMAGMTLVGFDEARVKLTKFVIKNLIVGQKDFNSRIYNHYYDDVLSEVSKFALQIGMIGSPRSLYRLMKDGAYELYYRPKLGWTEGGIYGCVKGVGWGFLGLLKNTGIGLTMSLQQFTNSVSQGTLILCQDTDFSRVREDKFLTEKPKDYVEGLGFGARQLFGTIASAIVGIVYRPIVEGRRNGSKGVLFGMYQGVTGLILKPTSGVFDLASKTSEGLKNTLRIFEYERNITRVRPPRPFYGKGQLMRTYHMSEAILIRDILSTVVDSYEHELFIGYRVVKPDNSSLFLILTEEHLFLIEAESKELMWQIKCNNIKEPENIDNGIIIHLKHETEMGFKYVLLPLQRSELEVTTEFLKAILNQF